MTVYSEEYLEKFLSEELLPDEMVGVRDRYRTDPQLRKRLDELDARLSREIDDELAGAEEEFSGKFSLPIQEKLLESLFPYADAPAVELSKKELAERWEKIWECVEEKGSRKNEEERRGILIRFIGRGKIVEEEIRPAKAAGSSDKIPPVIPVSKRVIPPEETISLTFSPHPLRHSMRIGFRGGSAKARREIGITLFYFDGTTELLEGKEIALGGFWNVDREKFEQIRKIELNTSL